jgi:hypothetical protein
MVELVNVFHRGGGGRVEAIEMKPREAEFACWRWPDQWSFDQRTLSAVRKPPARGTPVTPASLADEAKPIAPSLWKRT